MGRDSSGKRMDAPGSGNADVNLAVRLGNLLLSNPFVVGSGPTVRDLAQIVRAEDSGWAGASLKLAIEPEPYISLPPRYRWLRRERLHTFTAEKRLTPAQSLRLLEEARRRTRRIALLANITYDGADAEGWARMARRFQEAGAHALELNMCCPNMSYNVEQTGGATAKATGASLGADLRRLEEVVERVTAAVRTPVIAKLTPEGGRVAEAAEVCLRAGAAAVGSTGNRLGIADFDIRAPWPGIYRLQKEMTLGCLSGSWVRPLALRDTYEIRLRSGPNPFVFGAGGVSDLGSAVRQIMAGADALWVCTETMLRGFEWLPELLEELRSYMREMGFSRLTDFRDRLLASMASAQELTVHPGHAEVDPERCTACGLCWQLGHCPAVSHPDDVTRIDADLCLGCSTCVDVCPRGAIHMVTENSS